jgi:hypothetical protein
MNRTTNESTNEGSINKSSSFTNKTPTKTPIIAISPKLSQAEIDNNCQSNRSPKEKGFFRQLSGRMFGSQSSKNLDYCDSPKTNDKTISRKSSHDDNNDVIIKKSNSDIDSPSSRKYNFISIFTKRPSQETLSNNNQINDDKSESSNVSQNIERVFGAATEEDKNHELWDINHFEVNSLHSSTSPNKENELENDNASSDDTSSYYDDVNDEGSSIIDYMKLANAAAIPESVMISSQQYYFHNTRHHDKLRQSIDNNIEVHVNNSNPQTIDNEVMVKEFEELGQYGEEDEENLVSIAKQAMVYIDQKPKSENSFSRVFGSRSPSTESSTSPIVIDHSAFDASSASSSVDSKSPRNSAESLNVHDPGFTTTGAPQNSIESTELSKGILDTSHHKQSFTPDTNNTSNIPNKQTPHQSNVDSMTHHLGSEVTHETELKSTPPKLRRSATVVISKEKPLPTPPPLHPSLAKNPSIIVSSSIYSM